MEAKKYRAIKYIRLSSADAPSRCGKKQGESDSVQNQLDYFANELVRTAEIEGQIGSATTARAAKLRETTDINPTISWNKSGRIQLNNEFTVTLKCKVDIGFGGFGNFPITLESKASGKSEVYWKT